MTSQRKRAYDERKKELMMCSAQCVHTFLSWSTTLDTNYSIVNIKVLKLTNR